MIRNRLSVLLAERTLKITKVAKETGISRNTITSTAQNDGKMIQLETINALCHYLKITPGEFFSYIPYDFTYQFQLSRNGEIQKDSDNAYLISAAIGVYGSNKELISTINLESRLYHTEARLGGEKLYKGFLYVAKESAEVWEELKKEIPIEFQVDISKHLEGLIYDYYQENFKYTDEKYTDLLITVEL